MQLQLSERETEIVLRRKICFALFCQFVSAAVLLFGFICVAAWADQRLALSDLPALIALATTGWLVSCVFRASIGYEIAKKRLLQMRIKLSRNEKRSEIVYFEEYRKRA